MKEWQLKQLREGFSICVCVFGRIRVALEDLSYLTTLLFYRKRPFALLRMWALSALWFNGPIDKRNGGLGYCLKE